jgi:hypothetical protein
MKCANRLWFSGLLGVAVVMSALTAPASVSSHSVGSVAVEITKVSGQNGNYTIEMKATAQGKDVTAGFRAVDCSVITPAGTKVLASYVRIGDSNGASANATLLAGIPVDVTVRWSLDSPRYTKLLRVGLWFNFDGWKELKFSELEVQGS